MDKTNTEILHHFYCLMLDMNFHSSENDMLLDTGYLEDPLIQNHLQRIKLQLAKSKAILHHNKYLSVIAEIKRLKAIGLDELNKILGPRQAMQLQPLFRKFEELTNKDEASVAEDQELLQLFIALKDTIDKTDDE